MNPFFIVRRALFKKLKLGIEHAKGKVLDFGAGSAPYRHLFECEEYIRVDMSTTGHPSGKKVVDVYYNGRVLPFAGASFDFVFSSEVFEHVFNLDEVLSELRRVLKPGGLMLITVPFVWDEHEQPYDFARYTSFGLQHILNKHGFVIRNASKTTGCLETLAQMFVVYLAQRRLLVRWRWLKLVMTPVLFSPILIAGMLLERLLPRESAFYHNNVILAQRSDKVS